MSGAGRRGLHEVDTAPTAVEEATTWEYARLEDERGERALWTCRSTFVPALRPPVAARRRCRAVDAAASEPDTIPDLPLPRVRAPRRARGERPPDPEHRGRRRRSDEELLETMLGSDVRVRRVQDPDSVLPQRRLRREDPNPPARAPHGPPPRPRGFRRLVWRIARPWTVLSLGMLIALAGGISLGRALTPAQDQAWLLAHPSASLAARLTTPRRDDPLEARLRSHPEILRAGWRR